MLHRIDREHSSIQEGSLCERIYGKGGAAMIRNRVFHNQIIDVLFALLVLIVPGLFPSMSWSAEAATPSQPMEVILQHDPPPSDSEKVLISRGQHVVTIPQPVGVPACNLFQSNTEYRLVSGSSPCRSYSGPCTSGNTPQCITAPESLTTDAAIIEQCCSGSNQYPWIEICPSRPPRLGCGFCLW